MKKLLVVLMLVLGLFTSKPVKAGIGVPLLTITTSTNCADLEQFVVKTINEKVDGGVVRLNYRLPMKWGRRWAYIQQVSVLAKKEGVKTIFLMRCRNWTRGRVKADFVLTKTWGRSGNLIKRDGLSWHAGIKIPLKLETAKKLFLEKLQSAAKVKKCGGETCFKMKSAVSNGGSDDIPEEDGPGGGTTLSRGQCRSDTDCTDKWKYRYRIYCYKKVRLAKDRGVCTSCVGGKVGDKQCGEGYYCSKTRIRRHDSRLTIKTIASFPRCYKRR
ncbi:hypothetical protein KKC60_05945, partial [Patescibacteria group bacterium]|nr:hypothetical protein [Patescibacteria group bacterium]